MLFEIIKQSKKSKARVGLIKTPSGNLCTPAFFPVATKAAVKTLSSENIKEIGFEGILANTYHLHLQPGEKIIKKLGGLHSFMHFPGVIATDSGGFQVFSLGQGIEHKTSKIPSRHNPASSKNKSETLPRSFVKIKEEGVYFQSHLDGSLQFLSPEKSVQIQWDLGSDIMFAFDHPSSPLDDYQKTKEAMERTHRWAIRCLAAQKKMKDKINKKLNNKTTKTQKLPGLFGIVQGGKYKELRQKSAQFIGNLDFDGFGVGGVFGSSYGDCKQNMPKVLQTLMPFLAPEKPRHLLGIGYLSDLEKAIANGIDLFDCVYPTRSGRHGVAITTQGEVNLKQAKFKHDKEALDKKCSCFVCQNYSRAYLHHLIRAQEITASCLLTYHNLWFFRQFFAKIREKILAGKF